MTEETTMNITDVAKQLDGSEYPNIGTRELFAKLRVAGIVVVRGHSDDVGVFEGAIHDEFYSKVALSETGLIQNHCEEGECCPNYSEPENSHTIDPIFDGSPDDPAWVFKTTLPHETFEVMEDGEVFQRGIVFRLSDAAGPAIVDQSPQGENAAGG